MENSELTIKKGYKQTDVGFIPEDWEVKEMGDVCKVNQGLQIAIEKRLKFPKEKSQIYITIQFLNDAKEIEYIKDFTPSVFCNEDDVLMTRTGNTGIIVTNVSGVFHNNFFKINFNRKILDKKYLVDYLRTEKLQRLILVKAGTSTIPDLNHNDFYSIPIVIPPLAEQQAIAEVLSDTDALITSLDALLTKKRNIKQGTMQLLLTGKKRLPNFSGDWETKTLGEIGEVTGAGVDKKINPNEVVVRLVNFLDVYRKDFIYSRDLNHKVSAPPTKALSCDVKKGDIFFTPSSEIRDDVAHSAIAMEDIDDAVYSYHIFRFRLTIDWDLLFRAYIFKTRFFLNQAEVNCEGSGKRYVISLRKFRQFTVLVPPTIEEQKAIARILSEMDAEIEALEIRRDKYKAVKQGMMQELLTGKTRLI